MSFRRYFATSSSPVAQLVRRVYHGVDEFSIPAPKVIVLPVLYLFLAIRFFWHFLLRVFFAEPLFKAYCTRHGRHLHTDIRLHWVRGKGNIIIGDHVKLDGLCTFAFAARFADKPTLRIGNHTGLSSGCILVIGKSITIGNHCRIGGGVTMRDSDGHATESEARKRGDAPLPDSVRPIVIEDNVWIGSRASIGPGITIGEGSIVSANAVVLSNVAPYTIMAGNPARRIGVVAREETNASES